jgi:hypothetical protein
VFGNIQAQGVLSLRAMAAELNRRGNADTARCDLAYVERQQSDAAVGLRTGSQKDETGHQSMRSQLGSANGIRPDASSLLKNR